MSLRESSERREPRKPEKALQPLSSYRNASHIPGPRPLVTMAGEEPRQHRPKWTTYEAIHLGIIIQSLLKFVTSRHNPPLILPSFHIPPSPTRRSRGDQVDCAEMKPAMPATSDHASSQSSDAGMCERDEAPHSLPQYTQAAEIPALEQKHSERKEKLNTHFSHMLADSNTNSSHIFLCWGPSSRCEIVAVRLPDGADDVTVWRLIRQAWYANHRRWRRYVPFLSVRHIEIVRIGIAGALTYKTRSPETAGHFIGTRSPATELNNEKLYSKSVIAEHQPQEFPCTYYPAIDRYRCWETCPHFQSDAIECPERRVDAARRYLLVHNTLRFMPLAFANPELAADNDLFEGRNLRMSHLDMLAKIGEWHHPRLGELDFEALWLEDGCASRRGFFALAAVLIIALVIAAKFIFGDWGVAWTIGTFLVALAALYWETENV